MKKLNFALINVLICSVLISGCKEKISIQGEVLKYDNTSVPEAVVTVSYVENGDVIRKNVSVADQKGKFKIKVPKSASYTLNVSKKEYGLSSVNFRAQAPFESVPYQRVYLQKATVLEINPNNGGTVIASNLQSMGAMASNADWNTSPTGNLPLVLDGDGNLTGFMMPEQLRDPWQYQTSNNLMMPAARLSIKPNTIVDRSGSKPPGNVRVAFTAVDLYAPNGMPGSNIAVNSTGDQGPMQSFGAVIIDVFDDKQSYNLNRDEKSYAELIIPVPDWQRRSKRNFQKTIPLLYYDEETGLWNEEGSAEFIDSLNAYKGVLSHFSAVNFDYIKTDPSACASFWYDGPVDLSAPFHAEITIPGYAPRYRQIGSANPLCTTPTNGFSLNRLPPNEFAAVAFYQDMATPESQGLFVLKTRATGYADITSDPWGTPDCAQIEADTFCNKIQITKADFQDQSNLPNISNILVAICEEGTKYKLSFASNDPSFDFRDYKIRVSDNIPTSKNCDATTPALFLDLNMNPLDLDPFAEDMVASLIIDVDQTDPGIDSDYNVSILELDKTHFCNDVSVFEFKIEIILKADSTDTVIHTLIVTPGTCII